MEEIRNHSQFRLVVEELRKLLATISSGEDRIMSRIDAINARISHMQGRAVNPNEDVAENVAQPIGVGHSAGDPVPVREEIQVDETPEAEVEREKTTSEEDVDGEKVQSENVSVPAEVGGGGRSDHPVRVRDSATPPEEIHKEKTSEEENVDGEKVPSEKVSGGAEVTGRSDDHPDRSEGVIKLSATLAEEIQREKTASEEDVDGEKMPPEKVSGGAEVTGGSDDHPAEEIQRKKTTSREVPAGAHSTASDGICGKFWLMILLFIAGALCSFFSPFYLTTNTFSRVCWGGAAAVLFLVLSITGYKFRETGYLLRATPELSVRLTFIVLSSILTNIVANLVVMSQEDYNAFTLIGLAVFCLVELAQPTCDYGLLQFFVCLPLQIAIALHGLAFDWSYIPSSIIPLVCLAAQLHFVKLFDDMYERAKKNDPLRVPLMDGDDMV